MLAVAVAQSSKKMSELERLKRNTREMIEETNRMLSDTKKSTMSSLNQLNVLGQEIKTRRKLIGTLNQEISEIEKEQNLTNNEIRILQKDLEVKKEKYGKAIRSM